MISCLGRWFDERQIIADYWSQKEDELTKAKRAPCRSVILRDVFTDEQAASHPDFLKNLENDFGFECSKAGPISRLEVRAPQIYCTLWSEIVLLASASKVARYVLPMNRRSALRLALK